MTLSLKVLAFLITSVAGQPADTAVTRLHVSKMTCGSCPITARVALRKLSGVYDASVTLKDSMAVVRFDPRRVNPAQIAAYLTSRTGFPARVLEEK